MFTGQEVQTLHFVCCLERLLFPLGGKNDVIVYWTLSIQSMYLCLAWKPDFTMIYI